MNSYVGVVRKFSMGVVAMATGIALLGCGSEGAQGPAGPAGPAGAPGMTVTSNQRIGTYLTNMCTEFSSIQSCYFLGGQVVRYSDGSALLVGSFGLIGSFSSGGDTDTDTNQHTLTMLVPSNIDAAQLLLSPLVARGNGFRNLYLVWERSNNALALVHDTDNDGSAEPSDEIITSLSLISW